MSTYKEKDILITISLKIPKSLLDKIDKIRGEKSRSDFIREALNRAVEYSEITNKSTKMDNIASMYKSLEQRIERLEKLIGKRPIQPQSDTIIKKLQQACHDEFDRVIVNMFISKGFVKTKDLEKRLPIKHRQITNRIKRLAIKSNAIVFISGSYKGVTKAWWLKTELNELNTD
ncbi:MAG: ribbon-helix-helix domain-containing protein [Candidatus Asgardarchaeia archaeon]